MALFYNTAALEEVGVKAPTPEWKLDDLVEAVRRLTDPAKGQLRPGGGPPDGPGRAG